MIDVTSAIRHGQLRVVICLVITVALIFNLIACDGGGGSGSQGATVTGITVEPENKTPLYVSRTKQLKALATFSDGSSDDITDSVTWASSDTSKGTIDQTGLATGVDAGETLITAADTATTVKSAPFKLDVSAAILNSITVTQKNEGTIPLGFTKEMIATGNFSDNSTEDLTEKVIWSSSDEAVTRVSNDAGSKGLVTGVSAGLANISASDPLSISGVETVRAINADLTNITAAAIATVSDFETLQVTEATVSNLTITANQASLPGKYNFTQQFTATAILSNGRRVDATESATWTSSDSNVATVSDEAKTKGLVTALAPGQATISASAGGQTDAVTFTVNDDQLEFLRVTPSTPSPIPIGVYQQFSLTGGFIGSGSGIVEHDMTKLDTVTWRISANRGLVTSTDVASISNLSDEPVSFKGEVLGLSQGTAFVTATESVTNLVSVDVELDVEDQGLLAVGIRDENDQGITSLTCQSQRGIQLDTAQLKAIGFYASTQPGQNEKDLTKQVTWTSSDSDIVSVVDQPEDQKGLVACFTPGTATITATVPETSNPVVFATVNVTVQNRPVAITGIVVEPENRTPFYVDRTKQLKAIATFSDGSSGDVTGSVTWSSSDTSIATIDQNGLATGVDAGETLITADDAASAVQSTPFKLEVSDVTLSSITVQKKTIGSITPETTKEMTAIGTFSDNHTEDITEKVTWSSSDQAIATVSNNAGSKGLVTGVSEGSADITATDPSSLSGSDTVQVINTTVNSVSIAPNNPASLPGKYNFTQQFTATAALPGGDTVNATESATWASSDPNVATVSDEAKTKGLVTAIAPGQATISASAGGQADSVTFTVNDEQLDTLRVSPSTPSPIPIGVYQQFSLIGGFLSLGSGTVERDMTKLDTVTWRISEIRGLVIPTDVASISNLSDEPVSFKGEVLGLSQGTAFVSATESVTNLFSNNVEIEVAPQELVAVFFSDENGQGISELTCQALSGIQVDTFQLKAIGAYTGFQDTEKDLTKQVTWTSSNSNIVIVTDQPDDQKGFIVCGAPGSAMITIKVPETSGPVQATIPVTVNTRP